MYTDNLYLINEYCIVQLTTHAKFVGRLDPKYALEEEGRVSYIQGFLIFAVKN